MKNYTNNEIVLFCCMVGLWTWAFTGSAILFGIMKVEALGYLLWGILGMFSVLFGIVAAHNIRRENAW